MPIRPGKHHAVRFRDMTTDTYRAIEPDGRPDEDEELEKDVERPAEENEADPDMGKGE